MRLVRTLGPASLFGAVGMVMAALSPAIHAANLLVNPGFEAPPSNQSVDQTVAGWTLLDTDREGFANHTPGGFKSIWQKTFLPAGGGVAQNVNITAGSPYSLSAYEYFEAAYPTTEAVIQFSMTWLDAGNAQVGTPALLEIQPTSVTTTNVWTQYTLNATAPAGASQVRVFFGWVGGGTVTGAQSAFVDDADLEGPGTPPTNSVWANTGSGDYNVGANWANGTVPTGVGAEADFFGAITAAHTVYSDIAITAGTLKFNNANTYVLTGAGSLTMDVATGNGLIDVAAGSQKINLPLRLNKSVTASVATGATLTIADPLTLVNGATLNKTGNGTLEILSTVTSLTAASLQVSAGTANLRTDAGANTTLRASGGVANLFATQRVAAVQIDAGGTVAIDAAGPARVLKTNSLTIAGGTVPTGKLDLSDNGLIVQYSGTSPVETIRSQIVAAYNGGAWNGNGITTTASTSGRAIGYANSSAVGSPTSFLGEGFTGSAVLVRYTLKGDTNLDGTVTFPDLLSLAQAYGLTANQRWVNGDSDYDAAVGFNDLLALAQNYNQSLLTESQSAQLLAFGGSFGADWALAQSLVPEPTSLAAIGLCGAALMRRRRR